MKRRLTRAYDNMTMPDGCSHRIEQKLNDRLLQQKTGQYTKSITPAPVRRSGWAAAMAAVCLVLGLSIGGTMLFFRVSESMLRAPAETVQTVAAEEAALPESPEAPYAAATSLSAKKVESFAERIREQVLSENWDALANRISYSITIQDQEIRDKQKFIEWMKIFALNPAFMEAIRNESCEAMFCNWQGICMGDGQIWFNEVDGELRITAVNVEAREEVLKKDQKRQVPMEFASVLSGKAVRFLGNSEEMTLDQYCTALWGEVTVKSFTVVDMDDDTVSEVVVCAQTAEETDQNHLVLRQEGTEICAYPFLHRDLYDLKKDGSFSRSSYGPSQGTFWLSFEGKGSCAITREHIESDSPPADWHAYPCMRSDLVLKSYEYAGTGQSLLPGHPYYTFELLIRGEAGNNWEAHKEQMSRWGMICVEEEGTVSVFDPDAPGCCMVGILTNTNGFAQFADIGYYISNEFGERQAEVRNLLADEPEYLAGTNLELLDAHGRTLSTVEELLDYLQ